jgi:hypothetical protein
VQGRKEDWKSKIKRRREDGKIAFESRGRGALGSWKGRDVARVVTDVGDTKTCIDDKIVHACGQGYVLVGGEWEEKEEIVGAGGWCA